LAGELVWNFQIRTIPFQKKNYRQAKSGMTFNFCVGFENLVDKEKQDKGLNVACNYSIMIADTVLVTDDQPEFFTKYSRNFVDYALQDEKDNNNNNENNKNVNKNNDDDDTNKDDNTNVNNNENNNKKRQQK